MDREARAPACISPLRNEHYHKQMTTLHDPTRSKPTLQSDGYVRALGTMIQRIRRRLLWRGMLRWIGCAIGTLAILVLLDYGMHLNSVVRSVLLLLWISMLCVLYRRWIWSTQWIRPSRSDLALNLPTPATRLAAVVDLRPDDENDEISVALHEAVARRSSTRIELDESKTPMRAAPMYEMLAIGVGVILMGLVSINQYQFTGVGLRRALTPWTNTAWPKRFEINLPEIAKHHPSDRAFIAKAQIGPSKDDPNATLRWRLTGPDGESLVRWTTLGLNKQGKGDQESTPYEQLIPIHTLTATTIPEGSTLEYRIQSNDDQSDTQRVTIVHPPKLVGLQVSISLPEYAQQLGSETIRFLQGEHETLPSEPSFGPILAGSEVELTWSFSTAVHEQGKNGAPSKALTRILTPESNTTATVQPIDQYGLTTREPVGVFMRVVEDAPPEVLLSQPSTDRVVGRRAVVELEAMLSDDLGLREAFIEMELIDSEQQSSLIESMDSMNTRAQIIESEIDLQSLDLEQGQRIGIIAGAVDIQGAETKSSTRVLRIVDDQEIVDLVESQLGSMSDVLKRLDDRQRSLIEAINQEPRPQLGDQARNQNSISDQIRSRAESARSLLERLQESRIADPQISPMLEAIEESLDRASDSSDEASEALQQEQLEESTEQMDRVREQLERSIAMLDRGKDTWIARRSIEDLRAQVEDLLSDTQQLDAQTGGRSLDQLSEDQRSMLQKILDRQKRAAEEAREMIDSLDEQADALDKQNPTGAQGIRDAATQGRNAGIEEQLEQAAEELEQNQTASAAGTQQQVLEELDNMLEQIEQAQKNRDSALRRKLATLIESIQGILQDQQQELTRLDNGAENLDQPLIALRSNTLAVRDEAAAAFPETQTIAESMSRASDAQADAITSMRANPVDLVSARQSELSAITHLQAALDEAQRQDQMAADRQTAQLRNELRAKYQDTLKEQARITTETRPLVGDPLDRRQRATARQLARDESQLSESLRTMLDETKELSDAPIFSLAHDQLDRMLESVSQSLNERTLDPMIVSDQQAIASILQALIDVLSDQQQNQSEDFEDGQGGGGGGQGGGGEQPVIPPVAQLQLLKALQELTAMQTRTLSEQSTQDPDRVREIGRMQRDLAEKGQELIQSMNPDPTPIEQESGDAQP